MNSRPLPERPAANGREELHVQFNEDIVARALENALFREVLSTARHSQVVVMSVHPDVDQVLVFVAGEGAAILDGERSIVGPGRLVHVPSGTRHNFVNTGSVDMRLYTVYAPPEHAPAGRR